MSNTFIRKIIYLLCIGGLLIPLSLISRPSSRETNVDGPSSKNRYDAQMQPGGKLSRLRDQYELSQARLMEIDPASETMKLASLGLRGVAVNMLWMQAIEHRKKENWDQLASTLNALIKIQPNFIKVWEYQAHNLAYNISVEFDDYEYRYHWVKKGISFLTEGIPYNRRDHRMTDNLGFFTGMKIGRSDESHQFRRMFREDRDFRDEMEPWVEPDSYYTREYGYDNWKMAYQWFDQSLNLVENELGEQHTSDMMFYRKRPMQLMNQADGLQGEFRTDDVVQEIWRSGNEEWSDYGQLEIRNSKGLMFTLESLAELDLRLTRKRAELDQLVPGVREELMVDVRKAANLTPQQEQALAIPIDDRNDEQAVLAQTANQILLEKDRAIDARVFTFAKEDVKLQCRRIIDDILEILQQMQFVNSYSQTVNYKYWKTRSLVESNDAAADARRASFDASEMKRRSIFDDEYVIDPQSGEKKILKIGAISLYETAFKKWQAVLDADPMLKDGELGEDIIDAVNDYYDMLRVSGLEWPDNFPLQEFIDWRAANDAGTEELPTTEDILERKSGRGEKIDQDANDVPKDDKKSDPDDNRIEIK